MQHPGKVGDPHERSHRLDQAPAVHREVEREQDRREREDGEMEGRGREEPPGGQRLSPALRLRGHASPPGGEGGNAGPEQRESQRDDEPAARAGFRRDDPELCPAAGSQAHRHGGVRHAPDLPAPRLGPGAVPGADLRAPRDRREESDRAARVRYARRHAAIGSSPRSWSA